MLPLTLYQNIKEIAPKQIRRGILPFCQRSRLYSVCSAAFVKNKWHNFPPSRLLFSPSSLSSSAYTRKVSNKQFISIISNWKLFKAKFNCLMPEQLLYGKAKSRLTSIANIIAHCLDFWLRGGSGGGGCQWKMNERVCECENLKIPSSHFTHDEHKGAASKSKRGWKNCHIFSLRRSERVTSTHRRRRCATFTFHFCLLLLRHVDSIQSHRACTYRTWNVVQMRSQSSRELLTIDIRLFLYMRRFNSS